MRKAVFTISALGLFTAAIPPAVAQVAGSWRVTGSVSGHDFLLDCRFDPGDVHFGGICIEAGGADSRVKPGKVHKLSQGSTDGRQVRWGYPVKVMFMSIDLNFVGTMTGNTMSGDVSAAGRSGKFSAIRK